MPGCAVQTYVFIRDDNWKVPEAQRRESAGSSSGWRLDLTHDPMKMDPSLLCPKPQFLSLTPRSKTDFEGAAAPVRNRHLGSQGDLCLQPVQLSHRHGSLGLTLEAVASCGPRAQRGSSLEDPRLCSVKAAQSLSCLFSCSWNFPQSSRVSVEYMLVE